MGRGQILVASKGGKYGKFVANVGIISCFLPLTTNFLYNEPFMSRMKRDNRPLTLRMPCLWRR